MRTHHSHPHLLTSFAGYTGRALQTSRTLFAVTPVLAVLTILARLSVFAILARYPIGSRSSRYTVQSGLAGHTVPSVQSRTARHAFRSARPRNAFATRWSGHSDVTAIALLTGLTRNPDRSGRTVILGGTAETSDGFVLCRYVNDTERNNIYLGIP